MPAQRRDMWELFTNSLTDAFLASSQFDLTRVGMRFKFSLVKIALPKSGGIGAKFGSNCVEYVRKPQTHVNIGRQKGRKHAAQRLLIWHSSRSVAAISHGSLSVC
jgi:hypothetical protein